MFLSLYRGVKLFADKLFTSGARTSMRRLGSGTLLELPIKIWGESRIEIGSEVFIGPQSWIQVLTREGNDGSTAISIGDRTSIAGLCTISAAEQIVIEQNVIIARHVHITDHSHAFESTLHPIMDQGIDNIAPVRICEGAWIGHGVVVCPGVTIGRNAVIGANSVVRQDVPDFSVAAGVPARVIRTLTRHSPFAVAATSSL